MYAAQNADFSVPVCQSGREDIILNNRAHGTNRIYCSHQLDRVLCERLVFEMAVRPDFCSVVAASLRLVMLHNWS